MATQQSTSTAGTKGSKGSSKAFIKQKVVAAKIQLIQENKLTIGLIRLHLGIQPDDRNPETFWGTEDTVKNLIKALAKAKLEKQRSGK
jgi:hypothetical protein